MNESTIQDDRDFANEARIERLAQAYFRASSFLAVPNYRWSEDERRRFIADCVWYARNQLEGDEQESLFRECLSDILPEAQR